jgi:hypothetical protein
VVQNGKEREIKKDPAVIRMLKNPFNPAGPADPRYYADRTELLSIFRNNVKAVTETKGVTKPINLAVTGQWGTGKSSTLYKFKDILENETDGARIFSSYVSLTPSNCKNADSFFACILETLFRDYETTVPLPGRLIQFIKDESVRLNRWKIKKMGTTAPEFERVEEDLNAVNFKNTLLEFWVKLKESNFDMVVIMLDDLQYVLSQDNGEILYDLRTDMQSLSMKGALFTFVICTPENLFPRMRTVAEPFTRLFTRYELKPFDLQGTAEQIQKPLDVEKIPLTLSETTIQEIHDITQGHPYFICASMKHLLDNVPEGTVSADGFQAVCPDIREYFANVKFNADFDKATESEKEILLRIASLNEPEFSPKEVGGRSKITYVERLVAKGLVTKIDRGKYKLYTPLFADYLQLKTKDTSRRRV